MGGGLPVRSTVRTRALQPRLGGKSTHLTRGVDVRGWWWLSWTIVALEDTDWPLSFRQLSSLMCSLLTSACSICMETLTKNGWNLFEKKIEPVPKLTIINPPYHLKSNRSSGWQPLCFTIMMSMQVSAQLHTHLKHNHATPHTTWKQYLLNCNHNQ